MKENTERLNNQDIQRVNTELSQALGSKDYSDGNSSFINETNVYSNCFKNDTLKSMRKSKLPSLDKDTPVTTTRLKEVAFGRK